MVDLDIEKFLNPLPLYRRQNGGGEMSPLVLPEKRSGFQAWVHGVRPVFN